mmetsp:Transcript_27857/g.44708  ORF Transcript_27857/g.44708 Transcript_27857/m.44708 type:complete len:108 (+) Transcript_27857:587-910(+)
MHFECSTNEYLEHAIWCHGRIESITGIRLLLDSHPESQSALQIYESPPRTLLARCRLPPMSSTRLLPSVGCGHYHSYHRRNLDLDCAREYERGGGGAAKKPTKAEVV